MKRLLVRLFVALMVVAAALVVTWFRPELVPAWARLREPGPGSASPEGKEVEARPERIEEIDDGWCSRPGAQPDPNCRPTLPPVRLSTPETARRIGLETARVTRGRHAHYVTGHAVIAYEGHHYAEVRSRVSGRIADVPVDEGQTVRKGTTLVVLDSAEVGTDKANYISARVAADLAETTYERTRKLAAAQAMAGKAEREARGALERAKADLLNARQRLLNLGFTEAELEEIFRTKDTSSLLNIIAPMDGTLVERHAVVGDAVQPSPSSNNFLFAISDVRTMWAMIDVYESEAPKVSLGQPVTFVIDGTEERVFHGFVELIEFAVNPATRTVRVRGEMRNQSNRLRAGQFGVARIQIEPEHEATLVPRSAVQTIEGVDAVFLPQPDGQTFRPQRVALKPTDDDRILEVVWGLKPGDEVVTTGAFLLKSEMLKEQIAGD
ncbi:MAG: efflux RND transporter periplasmic adaptor subunit [Isosphaeraceae bacterium]|nr:efflux RND transporter periplasmic adaptor subunit [Isosphaeraceae bacterium]